MFLKVVMFVFSFIYGKGSISFLIVQDITIKSDETTCSSGELTV